MTHLAFLKDQLILQHFLAFLQSDQTFKQSSVMSCTISVVPQERQLGALQMAYCYAGTDHA